MRNLPLDLIVDYLEIEGTQIDRLHCFDPQFGRTKSELVYCLYFRTPCLKTARGKPEHGDLGLLLTRPFYRRLYVQGHSIIIFVSWQILCIYDVE